MNDDIALTFESIFLPRPVNPYTLAEERVWQRIVGLVGPANAPITQTAACLAIGCWIAKHTRK